MKIAAYCSFVSDSQIGGGQTAAFQFQEWCKILGQECDVVTLKKDAGLVSKIFDIKVCQNLSTIEKNYDFILFTTPSWGLDYEIDYSRIRIPYAVMVRGENDDKLFGGRDKLLNICDHAAIKIFNAPEYYGMKADHIHCVISPKYCVGNLNCHIARTTGLSERKGMVYFGRMSKAKDIDLLARLTHIYNFMFAVESVDVIGYYNDSESSQQTKRKIDEINPKWNMRPERIVTFDYLQMNRALRRYKFIWEYSTLYAHPRFSISALEAMYFGCLPVVNLKACPEIFRDKQWVLGPSTFEFIGRVHYDTLSSMMYKDLLASPYSYSAIKEMNRQLIRKINSV